MANAPNKLLPSEIFNRAKTGSSTRVVISNPYQKSSMSISKRVISGSYWVLGLRFFEKGMGAVKLFILSRLLAPQEFGLFAIASLILLAFDALTRTGFNDAIIHKRDNIDSFLHTAYWIQVVRGVVLAILVILSAPYIATFFEDPRIAPIVSMLALTLVLQGFRSIGVVLLQRDINFRTESIYLTVGNLIIFVTTIILAWQLHSVWAIIIGTIVGETSLMILSYFVHSYRPKFTFSLDKARELFRFGIWLFLAGIVSYLALQADSIFIGKWLSVEELGIYYMAYKIANLFIMDMLKPLGKVLKPAYAELQTNQERLRVSLEKSLAITIAIVFPISAFLIITAPMIVIVVLGNKWEGVIPILPILVVCTIFRGLAGVGNVFFIATGKPKIVFFGELLRTVVLLLCLFPSFMLAGMEGVAWAVTISTGVLLFFAGMYLFPMIQSSFVTRDLLPVSLSTTIIAIQLFLQSAVLPSTWYSLIGNVVVLVLLYTVLMWILVGRQAHLNIVKILLINRLTGVNEYFVK